MPPQPAKSTKNLKVSLPKLSLPPEVPLPCPCSNKKMRLDPDKSPGASQGDSSVHCKCNVKVLPKNMNLQNGNLKVKSECEDANLVKTERDDMKMEIAKIDSILQGKLLLEKSSHKLCDMVILDKMELDCKVKQEFDCTFDNKKHLQFSNFKNEKSCKVEKEEFHSNNNNLEKDFKLENDEEEKGATEEELVTCKWEGCGVKLRVKHLLDHLSVSLISNFSIKKFNSL